MIGDAVNYLIQNTKVVMKNGAHHDITKITFSILQPVKSGILENRNNIFLV